jgi:hypothetical protein
MTTPSALHQAAGILLRTASESVLRDVLRLLLAEDDNPSPPPPAKARTVPTLKPAKARTTAKRGRRASPERSAAWAELHRLVGAKMRDRGMDHAALAAELGYAVSSVRCTLNSTRDPATGMATALRKWLDGSAPAVAVPLPFRGSPTRRTNGSATTPAA